jgi:hypothetical protein
VLLDGRLVGIVTDEDFMDLASKLLEEQLGGGEPPATLSGYSSSAASSVQLGSLHGPATLQIWRTGLSAIAARSS